MRFVESVMQNELKALVSVLSSNNTLKLHNNLVWQFLFNLDKKNETEK